MREMGVSVSGRRHDGFGSLDVAGAVLGAP